MHRSRCLVCLKPSKALVIRRLGGPNWRFLCGSLRGLRLRWHFGGGWRVVHGRANATARSELQAALWLICALHIVQGAGAGAVVPADAPFRPAPLSSVIVVLITTALLSRGLARVAQSTPSSTAATDAATQNSAENPPDDLTADLGTNRSNSTPSHRAD